MDFQRLRVAWNVKACHEAEGNPKMAVRILNISVDFFLFVPYLFRLVSTELKDQTLSCQTLFSASREFPLQQLAVFDACPELPKKRSGSALFYHVTKGHVDS